MMYNILAFGDIHWGAIAPQKHFNSLDPIIDYISKNSIDLIVICGDYFDMKLSLNSKTSRLAIEWLYRLIAIAERNNVKAIRIVKGTEDHDNDQLEIFRPLESDFFKIFNYTTTEETLPGLYCIYCPDENISEAEYMSQYQLKLESNPSIGFFHGNFDVVMPEVALEKYNNSTIQNVLYRYRILDKYIKGPMISGHWHNAFTYEKLYYIGSFNRWTFNEEEPKGFIHIEYDTDADQYKCTRIENIYADQYITFNTYTNTHKTIHDYDVIIKKIESIISLYKDHTESEIKIRIVIHITNDDPNNDVVIGAIMMLYNKSEYVKVVVKNKYLKEQRKKVRDKKEEVFTKYGYVADKKTPTSEIIHKFILDTKGQLIDPDKIDSIISKYLKD